MTLRFINFIEKATVKNSGETFSGYYRLLITILL